ncbi:hypothetical protein ACJ3XI_06070 [Litorimonas sp. RW-G-Af-16]|uniref:hypothetical protein n=1 Tax=Litorimonas sp. RW-G-Af-16 TaxID=3241168 RepID=UPI00390C8B67
MPNLRLPLFLTRLSIAIFLLPWILMRFIDGGKNAKGISEKYYHFTQPDIMTTLIGVGWVILLIAFIIGFKKKISYGLVFLIHLVGTLMSLPYMIPGTEKFIPTFMAAIPTLMAMFLLWKLREQDTLLSLN